MKKFLIYITLIGLAFTSCKKDETRVVMLDNPVVPTFKTFPDLTLQRANGTDTLVFVGTPVDPGFQASAIYYLEACAAGTDFADAIKILSDVQDEAMKITVSDLNGILLKKFPADQVSSLDFRIRCALVQDAGTGYIPKVYISVIKTADVTLYGLPRLDLLDSGIDQKIESSLGDGSYTGYVKLDASKPFTLKDPDANIVYGADGAALAVNGAGIEAPVSGWYKLTANTIALTYTLESYMIGLVGSATANGWNTPDTKMDYDSQADCWYITTDLTDAQIKFRLNDGWAVNWGGKGSSDGSADNYTDPTTVPLATGGKNIGLNGGAGNYTIKLFITDLKATIVKN